MAIEVTAGARTPWRLYVPPTPRTEHGGLLKGTDRVLALLKYPFYPLFILDNGMNLISKSLTVLTPA